MPVQVQWYDPDCQILHIQISQNWTWPEMHIALDEVWEKMDTVEHRVYTIFNTQHADGWPPHTLANLRQANHRFHPNSAHVMIVGLSVYHRTMMDIYTRFYGRFVNPFGLYHCASLEDAERMIGQIEAGEVDRRRQIKT